MLTCLVHRYLNHGSSNEGPTLPNATTDLNLKDHRVCEYYRLCHHKAFLMSVHYTLCMLLFIIMLSVSDSPIKSYYGIYITTSVGELNKLMHTHHPVMLPLSSHWINIAYSVSFVFLGTCRPRSIKCQSVCHLLYMLSLA